jgi:hypothetical protein
MGMGAAFLVGAPAFVILGYFFIFWDKRSAESASKDDDQVGIKLVLLFLVVVGISIAAGGLQTLLHYLLSGAKTGTPNLKAGIATVISGGLVVFLVAILLLPRTNSKDYSRATRFACGYLAAVAGVIGAFALNNLVNGLIGGGDWAGMNSAFLAELVVMGGIAFLSLNKFGSLSGWTAPVKAAMPQQAAGGYPHQAQAPQQSGGMPQGYPPQGGGYPPQGQGGGGYPPQGGGGYPPQGGGGYPPQGGGGYPPQGQGGGGGYQPR